MKGTWVAVVAAVALAGCGGHQVDRAAWSKELAAGGTTVSDWSKYEQAVENICAMDDPSTFLAVALDKKNPSMRDVMLGYKYECPDRMDRFKAGLKRVEQANGAASLACDTPAEQRTQDQKDLAEAMGC